MIIIDPFLLYMWDQTPLVWTSGDRWMSSGVIPPLLLSFVAVFNVFVSGIQRPLLKSVCVCVWGGGCSGLDGS